MKSSIGSWLASLVVLVTLPLSTSVGKALTIEPVDEPVVVDANGKKVGKMIDTGVEKPMADIIVQLSGTQRLFKLQVLRDAIDGYAVLSFESTDCSGTPYIASFFESAPVFEDAVVAPPGHTLYVRDVNATSQTITEGSEFYDGSCQPFGFGSVDAVPAVPVINLDTLFTPPFSLKAGSGISGATCCGDCDGNGVVTVDEILTGVNEALNGCRK